MEIKEVVGGNVLIIELNGRLDALVSDKTAKYFEDSVSGNDKSILVDLKNLNYINSTGLRIFIITFKALKAKGKSLVICNLQNKIKEVFQHSGFDNFFDVDLSKEAALRMMDYSSDN